jgi:hypothetical protein
MMYLSSVFVLALTSTVAAAFVIERQVYNRTADCLVTSGLGEDVVRISIRSLDMEFLVSDPLVTDGTVHLHPNTT